MALTSDHVEHRVDCWVKDLRKFCKNCAILLSPAALAPSSVCMCMHFIVWKGNVVRTERKLKDRHERQTQFKHCHSWAVAVM